MHCAIISFLLAATLWPQPASAARGKRTPRDESRPRPTETQPPRETQPTTPAPSFLPGDSSWAGGRTTPAPPRESDSNAQTERDTSPPWLRAAASVGLLGRRLLYTGKATSNVREHRSVAQLELGLHAELYPLAALSSPWLAHWALGGGYTRALVGQSQVTGTTSRADTAFDHVYVHFLMRLPLDPVLLGFGLRWGYERFMLTLPASNTAADELPSASYNYIRPTLEVSAQLDALRLGLAAGYRAVLDSGVLAQHFPHTTPLAFDVELRAAYALTTWFGLQLRATYSYVHHNLNAIRFDPYVADTAHDHIYALRLEPTFTF